MYETGTQGSCIVGYHWLRITQNLSVNNQLTHIIKRTRHRITTTCLQLTRAPIVARAKKAVISKHVRRVNWLNIVTEIVKLHIVLNIKKRE